MSCRIGPLPHAETNATSIITIARLMANWFPPFVHRYTLDYKLPVGLQVVHVAATTSIAMVETGADYA